MTMEQLMKELTDLGTNPILSIEPSISNLWFHTYEKVLNNGVPTNGVFEKHHQVHIYKGFKNASLSEIHAELVSEFEAQECMVKIKGI